LNKPFVIHTAIIGRAANLCEGAAR
jgi:hypothetical protein